MLKQGSPKAIMEELVKRSQALLHSVTHANTTATHIDKLEFLTWAPLVFLKQCPRPTAAIPAASAGYKGPEETPSSPDSEEPNTTDTKTREPIISASMPRQNLGFFTS